MIILVTGSAGFIGSELSIKLLQKGHKVIGIDNHNNYYDPALKLARLKRFKNHKNYHHFKLDIFNGRSLNEIFKTYKPKYVANLAAQAGVRYSIQNPMAYINSNIVGFMNILECCRNFGVEHLVYASSSSVYGSNRKLPFSEEDSTNHPLSIYAASKKSNELMAHTYSHLFNLPTTGLRFFTVYGPWGRPDMALFKFTKSILEGDPIDVFNKGNHSRDFTYIDDIISGIIKTISSPPIKNKHWDSKKPNSANSNCPWRIYNIGNGKPVNLMKYINAIELILNKKVKKNFISLQSGDVPDTFADTKLLIKNFNYKPATPVNEGIKNFIKWYRSYYKK